MKMDGPVVARVVRDDGAGGLNTLTSTNYLPNSLDLWLYLLMWWLKHSASLPDFMATLLGVKPRTYWLRVSRFCALACTTVHHRHNF